MYRKLKSPITVQLELTTGCNHNCIHCYNHYRESKTQSATLCEEEIRKIINNLTDAEVPSLLITGGEPMLYPDLMLKAFELAANEGMSCFLNTNATLVTPSIAKELKRLKVNVLTSILSFDHEVHDEITKTKGSFNKLLDGIRILQEHKVPVSANMVVMKHNLHQIYETGALVHKLGVSKFTATKVHPAQGAMHFDRLKLSKDNVISIFDTLLEVKEKLGIQVESLMTCPLCLLKDMNRYSDFLGRRTCSAGKTGCTIGSDGQLRSCSHADDAYGNAIDEPIGVIWSRLEEWRDGSLLPIECKDCKYIIECSGGCRMDCKFNGKIDAMDPYATGNDFSLLVPEQTKETPLISVNESLSINKALVFREESFGSGLIIEGDFKTIVNSDSAELLKNLVGSEFKLKEVSDKFKVDELMLREFFTALHAQGIVVIL